MTFKYRLAFALFPLLSATAGHATPGDSPAFQASGSAEFWAYGMELDRVRNSVLNPLNRVAKLPSAQWIGEARLNLRIRSEDTEIALRPRLLAQHNNGNQGDPDTGDAYLSQAFGRARLSRNWTLTAGRELLTWGPAAFRSPSNPIYFDAGRTSPLRDVSGVDLVRMTYTDGPLSAVVGRVQSAGHLANTPEHLSLVKADLRGDDRLASIVIATPVYGAPFLGSFAQVTVDDAWMVYGEVGFGKRANNLLINASPRGAPFVDESPAPRRGTGLIGVSYTLESGQSLSGEILHDSHGYSRGDERRFFARASLLSSQYLSAPDGSLAPQLLRSLGQGIAQTPLLLNQDYFHFLWQSNPQDSDRYWRLMWTRNGQDRSHQISLYGEKSLSPRFTLFAAAIRNFGGPETDFGSLTHSSLTIGLKIFAF